jgi:hypothetical protein
VRTARSTIRRRAAGGRPPKFREPSRPITVTLPERTLDLLGAIDGDRARAIVSAAECAVGASQRTTTVVDVVRIDDDAAVVIIGPCPSLAKVPWVRPVEIAPGRYLISIDSGTSVDTLEIALVDLLEHFGERDGSERSILEQLLVLIRRRRRDRTITKGEILFVPPERSRRAR